MVTASKLIDGEEIITVFWRLGHIPPRSAINVVDFAFTSLPTHELEWVTDVTFKDGIEGKVSGHVSLSFFCEISVTARNLTPKCNTMNIAFRRLFKGKLEDYLASRIDDKGKINDLDKGRNVFITFEEFVRPDFDKAASAEFKRYIREKTDEYQEMINDLVPSKFRSEKDARKHLWEISKRKTLEAKRPTAVGMSTAKEELLRGAIE